MLHKKLIASTVILFGLGLTKLQAQVMYVRVQNGTQTAYTLSNIQKVTFAGGQMQIKNINGNTENYTLSNLRYINFTDLTTGIVAIEHITDKLHLYPNPVVNELNLTLPQTAGENSIIEIYTLDGRKVYHNTINQTKGVYSLNLSFLEKGIYMCKLQINNQIITSNFIKIKQ